MTLPERSQAMIDLRACSAALVVAIGTWGAALAGPGEDAGWSLSLDPRRRAFLIWRSQPGQARDLLVGCLRDVASFTARSETLGSLGEASRAQLVLTSGPMRFEAAGAISRDQDNGQSIFDSEVDIDGVKGQALVRQLMPVLEGRGEIRLTISAKPDSSEIMSRNIPVAGLAPLLKRFRAVCFK